MNLRQQIIHDQVEKLSQSLAITGDQAFVRFAHSLIVGQSIHAFNSDDFVDGGQDKQIDTITIDQDGDEATVYILQIKNTNSFSSNALIQMHNGLNWIFNKSRSDINTLPNRALKDKILEYRSIQSAIGPSNIYVIAAFVTNGSTSTLSDEFRQEQKTIIDQYDNSTFAKFQFQVWGADELVNQLNIVDRRSRRVDADIRIRYDANNPSLIKYFAENLKGLVCTATASEIAQIINSDPSGSVFDSNIRQFLGTRGAVNTDIHATCSQLDSSYLFWFLNNGITIVCDQFDAVTDPDNPHIKIKNMQIVNGCQTATTLALAQKEGKLAQDVRVLLRVYETGDNDLVSKIVLTTNNQNKISSRNLRANDLIQLDMERGFSMHSYFYERKPRQYDNQSNIDATKIIPNELVAQAYLGIILKRPSDASRRKYKVWSELYNDIFGGKVIELYLLAILIHGRTAQWLRSSGYKDDPDDIRRKVAKNGIFHVARVVSNLWRSGDNWKIDSQVLQLQLNQLEKNPSILDSYLEKALAIVVSVISSHQYHLNDLDNALKSYMLDEDLSRYLHSWNHE
jgi:hypothetical protein